MRRTLLTVLVLEAIALGAAALSGQGPGDAAAGYTGTTLALGRFGEIDVVNHQLLADDAARAGSGHRPDLWLALQQTKGDSDVYVQNNVWQPGGTTGWHTHSGHSLIIVTAGTLTVYEGDDGRCTPHVYTAGMGLVDRGGSHAHVIRNEDRVEARTVAVQLVPAGAVRRIDAAGNPACRF